MYDHLIKDQFLEVEENGETFVFFIDERNMLQFVGSFCEELEYYSPSVKSFFESLKGSRDLNMMHLTVDFDFETNMYFLNGTFHLPKSSNEFMGLLSLIKDQVFGLKDKFQKALETDLVYVKNINN